MRATLPLVFGGGLVLGGVWPRGMEPGSTGVPPRPQPIAVVPRISVDDPACAPRMSADAALGDLEASRARRGVVQDAFEADWGRPIAPPDGFDALQDSFRYTDTLKPFDLELVQVTCVRYPCVLAVADEVAPDLPALADALGVRAEDLVLGTTQLNGRALITVRAALLDPTGLTDVERRWAQRLRDREGFGPAGL